MKNRTTLKAILFDFMGVLLFEKADYRPDPLVDVIDQMIGMVTNDSVFKIEAVKRYNLSDTKFDNILIKIIDKYEKFQPLWELIPDLKNKYKLAIINNGTSLTLKELHKRHHVKEYFDLFISSAIEGISKPDPEIFLLAAHRLRVKPEECLFMDDTRNNLEGAEKTGMKTIWWENKWSGFTLFEEFLATVG